MSGLEIEERNEKDFLSDVVEETKKSWALVFNRIHSVT